jgi:hypothetical protein
VVEESDEGGERPQSGKKERQVGESKSPEKGRVDVS